MKDPAALIYIDKWLVSTKGMRANAKGWYLNLILHQYDKNELPNDIEELANLCDVRVSEYEEFKQVFEQVLKQKFELNDRGYLENSFASEIIRKRETFKDKRSDSGKLSYVLKYFRLHFKYKKGFEEFFKENVIIDFDIKNEQVLKQMFKQTLELYINKDKDVIINEDIIYILDNVKSLFEEKYITKETNKILLSLLKTYNKETIVNTVIAAKNDSFWSNQFLSLNKLNNKNKDGVKYIDVFISKFKTENSTALTYEQEIARLNFKDINIKEQVAALKLKYNIL